MDNRRLTGERSSGMTGKKIERRYPIGAELIGNAQAHFRVWAPKAKQLEVAIDGKFHELDREADGYFSGAVTAKAGARYRFRLNREGNLYPDPASRYQPEGPHGPSCVVDHTKFQWSDGAWKGITLAGQIMYEMHVGTFTPEGTWRAAAEKLPLLKEDGITVLEMMPIADFPGEFGWGYDGVNMFAPCHLYGSPDDLRFFIDRAHAIGLGVILDVVYNHFGPDGNYLGVFSDDYMNRDRPNEWGDCINFDGRNSGPVREFFITNGRYWIDEFHFDGFRFDATQSIHDESDEYIVGAVGRAARKAAGDRAILLVAENEPQETKLIRPRSEGGDDLDALWNDDWHHSALVALTGNREAYFTDYFGNPQEFISAAKYGYLFQGQPYVWQEAPRGYSTKGARPEAFVSFIENHDQVANTAFGERVRFLTSPGRYRAMVALLLLGPWTPLLFQGQEFGAASAFRYFSDVGDDELKEAIRKGRFEFLAQFPSVAAPEVQARLPVPHQRSTFEGCKLDWNDREKFPQFYQLHRDLIRLRQSDSRFREQPPHGVDGAVLGRRAFVLRYFARTSEHERLLLVNFGKQAVFSPGPEPLLAPPDNHEWQTMWTSEAPEYGGIGMLPVNNDQGWTIYAESAVALGAVAMTKPRKKPKARNSRSAMESQHRPTVVRTMTWDPAHPSREVLLNREWLVTNGLGGYASGTVSGAITRKYHGILVAALPAPLGRVVMWNHVSEFLRFGDNDVVSLGAEERAGGQLDLKGAECLREFRLEDGMPVWIYHVRDLVIEKRISMPHLQNTVHVSYQLTGEGKLPRLELRPAFHFRHHEKEVDLSLGEPYKLTAVNDRYEIVSPRRKFPPLRMRLCGRAATFAIAQSTLQQVVYRTEQARGYAYEGALWSPGFFQVDLAEEKTATLIGSTESWDIIDVLSPAEVLAAERERRARLLANADDGAHQGVAAELVFAGDQFVITPAGRGEEAARAHAAGDEVRTVIAGYHWFTDWGRDTMISLEGLTLVTGRCLEAGYILRTFSHYVRDGLIPNMFPDRQKQGLYHTADATLWFFHALGRYLKKAQDKITLSLLLPILVDIAEHHLRGTKFNIHVDPRDGLLAQGEQGYQLTWMDAKMGDWVVTPRRGKAVELNALWFNALKLLEGWLRESGKTEAAERYAKCAEQTRESFNQRFWFQDGGYLYDVVDVNGGAANDSACRPNQLFAISLDHPVLDEPRWKSVVDVAEKELVTTVGLRSLAPNHPDYKPIYAGDLRSRDGAYHQGTVWAWLIGPFIDAWLKVHPGEKAQARKFLERFPESMNDNGIGTISEVFDAREPHIAGGCIAQAWSVAEVLRCWLKTA